MDSLNKNALQSYILRFPQVSLTLHPRYKTYDAGGILFRYPLAPGVTLAHFWSPRQSRLSLEHVLMNNSNVESYRENRVTVHCSRTKIQSFSVDFGSHDTVKIGYGYRDEDDESQHRLTVCALFPGLYETWYQLLGSTCLGMRKSWLFSENLLFSVGLNKSRDQFSLMNCAFWNPIPEFSAFAAIFSGENKQTHLLEARCDLRYCALSATWINGMGEFMLSILPHKLVSVEVGVRRNGSTFRPALCLVSQ